MYGSMNFHKMNSPVKSTPRLVTRTVLMSEDPLLALSLISFLLPVVNFYHKLVLPIFGLHVNGTIQYVVFYVQPPSASKIFVGVIHNHP